jgi:ABC-type multidrug transport system ATPase subunit
LNTLAGRIGAGELMGEILVDGQQRQSSTWKIQCAYVEQDDILFPSLTVFETLMYSARLRLPSNLSRKEKKERVEKVIAVLGLQTCSDTKIGDEKSRGISGGERKRVSIGVELVTNPHILFLDEPTSGLDAFNAFNVVQVIKDLAKKEGKIVLMTIHQPRTDILALFDKVLLLSAGKCLWFGPTDNAIDHFAKLGYALPPKTNPSDFFLDTITIDARTPELFDLTKKRVDLFHDEWKKIETVEWKKIETVEKNHFVAKQMLEIVKEKVKWPSSPFQEFSTLLGRNLLNDTRNKAVFLASMVQAVFLSFVISLIFWQSTNDQAGIQNRMGFFFFLSINLTFSVIMPSVNVFPGQKRLITRVRRY